MTSDEEEREDLVDEARDEEVAKAWAAIRERYKTFYGDYPDRELSIAEVQERIRAKMLRPFRL